MKLLAVILFSLFVATPLALSAVEKGYVPVERGQLFYEKTGSGPAIVLIHAHSVDRRMWDAQFFALAKKHEVIRYDLRGYGLSSLPQEGHEFSHVEDLSRLLKFLKIERAHLVGLSLGTWVALDFLAAHPEKTMSVTVASGGLHDPDNWRTETPAERKMRLQKNHADKLKSIQGVKKQGLAEYKRQWLDILLQWCGPNRDKIQPALQTMIQDWSGWQPLHIEPGEGTSLFADTRFAKTTSQILSERKLTTPMLILIGKNDVAGSQNASENLHKILPTAKVVHLPKAGHFSAMENPAAFNKALLDFLNSLP